MNNFEIKKKILLNGESEIYKNWKETVAESSGYELTEQEFLDALEWVCEDPCDGGKAGNRLTREIGLTNQGIVKIRRCYGATVGKNLYKRWSESGLTDEEIERRSELCTMYRDDTKMTWNGDTFYIIPRTEKERMFADENGRLPQPRKIGLSARDRI